MARRRTPQVVSERAQKFHNVLAASSGVIVPSKLRPGEMPFQGPGEMRKNIVDDILCSVCGRCFNNNYHVKSHFRACVKRNGNPFGRVWDDDFLAWTADSDGVPVLLSNSSVPQTVSTSHASANGTNSGFSVFNANIPQIASSNHPFVNNTVPQTTSTAHPSANDAASSLSALNTYDDERNSSLTTGHNHQGFHPYLAPLNDSGFKGLLSEAINFTSQSMDEYACMRQIILLPTEELLHALREWQDLILAGEQHVFEHPQFIAIIKEVQMRNLIDRDGNWMIEL